MSLKNLRVIIVRVLYLYVNLVFVLSEMFVQVS